MTSRAPRIRRSLGGSVRRNMSFVSRNASLQCKLTFVFRTLAVKLLVKGFAVSVAAQNARDRRTFGGLGAFTGPIGNRATTLILLRDRDRRRVDEDG